MSNFLSAQTYTVSGTQYFPSGGTRTCWQSPSAPLVSTLNVPVSQTITDASQIRISLNLSHTAAGELRVTITTPTGIVIPLIDRMNSTVTNPCGEQQGFDGNNTLTFVANAPSPLSSPRQWGDVFLPTVSDLGVTGNLNNLVGLNTNGDWRLSVTVGSSNGYGSLRSWSLTVAPSLTITARPSNLIFTGTSVTFSPTLTYSTGLGRQSAYYWRKNGVVVHRGRLRNFDSTYTSATLMMNDVITCELTEELYRGSTTITTSNPITMTVLPPPTMSLDITTGSQSICAGTPVTFTATSANEGPSPIYQWKKNGFNIGSNSTTYTDTTLVTNDAISCVMTSNHPLGTRVIQSQNRIMTVASPVVIQSIANQAICVGNSTAPIAFIGADATTFTWTNSNPNIGLASNGTNPIAAFTPVNNTNAPITATLTVTPTQSKVWEYAYIPNNTSNTVSVVNTTLQRVVATIPVGLRPSGIAVSPNGQRVYIANMGSNTVSVINTATNSVIGTIAVGANPFAVSVSANGQRVYVSNEVSNSVSVIDAVTHTIIASIPVAAARGMALPPNRNRLYVAQDGPNSLISILDLTADTLLRTMRIDNLSSGPVAVVSSPDGNHVYVTGYISDHVYMIHTANDSIQKIRVGSQPQGMATSLDGSRLYVANRNSNNVSVINTVTNSVIATIPVGQNPVGVSIGTDGRYICVANEGSDSISVIQTATNTVISMLAVEQRPIAFGNFMQTSQLVCSGTPATFSITVNPLPTATITPSSATTFCQGGNVVLNANTGNGLTYQWQQNGTAIIGATHANYTANTAGSYTVAVTNAHACTTTSNATSVIVNALPIATISNATPTTFCQGGNVVLNAPSTAGLTYQWRNNGIALNATNPIYVATTSGAYSVRVTDANNCATISPATTVVVNPMPTPVLNASGSRIFCQGDSVQFQISGGLTYQWSHGATDSAIWFKQAGFYTVTVTNQWGCSTPITQQIVVKPLPIATSSANGVTTFCQGGQVVLNANPGADLTYQWQRNGTPMLGATNPNYTANETGLYTVVVTGLNACSNTSNANSLIVNTLPIATITPASVTTFCQGGNVVLNANQGDGLTYRWNQNGTPINGATNANYTANTTGLYTVVVTNADNCSTTSTANQVIVNALPISSIANTTPILCNGDKSTLTVGATGGLAPYQYSTNGGNYQNSNLFELLAGNYNVNARDNNGCTSNNTALTLAQPTVLTIPTPTAIPLNCYDGFTNLQSTANGGTTPYQYSLTGFVFQNPNQFSVQGGTYQMVVRDVNGCRATSPLYNVVRPADLVLTTASNPIKCWGDTTYATIQVANAVAPIQYTLNGVSQNNDALFKGLHMGTYPVRVVDHRGCTKTTTLTMTQPPLLTASLNVDTIICKGKLTPLVVTATGGTGNLSYRLNAGTSQSNTFMVAAGEQRVQIRDANQCIKTLPPVMVQEATAKLGELMNLKINCHDMDMRIYPNPVVDVMSVDFKIAQSGVVKVLVYNALGDLIAHEDYKNIEAGSYTASWDTANWASDMLRVCLEVDGVCVQVTSVMIVH